MRNRVLVRAAGIAAMLCIGMTLSACRYQPKEWLGDKSWVPAEAVVVFQDDFDDGKLSGDAWNTCYWWSVDGGCTIASNNELEWYQPDNVIENDSTLRLEARYEPATGTDGTPFEYTSGMVTTGPPDSRSPAKFAFQYGGAQARVRIPVGAEFWPAFWLLPASTESRPEIDIMEMHGDRPTLNSVHLHSFDTAGIRLSWGDEYDGADVSTGWHTFGIRWSEDELVWFVDGVAQHRLSADNDEGIVLPAEPLYLVLNLAIDSEPHSAPAGPEAFPAALEVDWVQVWQLPSDASS
jgi:beta-glucanase (GH16 family)